MALNEEIREPLKKYVQAHIANEEWHEKAFDFISDKDLARRISEEFIAARYVYKLLEAISADEWLQKAQIRIQVFMYASIYEAVLHHVLFSLLPECTEVQRLTEYNQLKKISIPENKLSILNKHLEHDGKDIIPSFQGVGRTDETKVRFDAKAKCAASLGIIQEDLKDDLIEIYEARNAIHIHAEIRKSINYQLDLSKISYWRMQPFLEQVRGFVNSLNENIPVTANADSE